MEPMTHNYMLGLITLVFSFAFLFYAPIAYFCLKIRKQRKQNK